MVEDVGGRAVFNDLRLLRHPSYTTNITFSATVIASIDDDARSVALTTELSAPLARCMPGQYLADAGTESVHCRPCPLGSFQPSRGVETECLPCAPGTVAYSSNFDDVMQAWESCEMCQPGTYAKSSSEVRYSVCVWCTMALCLSLSG